MKRIRERNRAVFLLEKLEGRALLSGTTTGDWPLGNTGHDSAILLRFKDTSTSEDMQRVLNESQGFIRETLQDGPSILNIGRGVDRDALIAELASDPALVYAIPDQTVDLDSVPNDPSYSQQWGLSQSNGVSINASQAWSTTTGSASTVIAVIDTGLDVNHPEFAGRLWVNPTANTDGYTGDVNGYNFADYNNNLADSYGHGTHVTGIIAATGNNGVGVAGVNWNAKLMVLKYYGTYGGYLSSAIEAIYFAADHGAKVINASWGSQYTAQALTDAINYANSKGVVFVSAAGNNSWNLNTTGFYPASIHAPNTITVASINSNGNLSSFSNYGSKTVDIAAPGEGILSTVTGGYGYLSGTSMAAPFVTGVVSLVEAQHPDWTPAQVVQRVLSTAHPLSTLTGKVITGGIVDAAAAVGAPSSTTVSKIQVLDGSTDVLAGSSTVAFGSTVVGTSVTKTLTISDTGTAPLVLNGTVNLPSGFSLVSGFGSTTVAPGASTTIVVQMNATSGGSYSGILSFGTNDPTQSNVQITLTGTVTAPAVKVLDGTTDVLSGNSSVSFGNATKGTSVSRTLTVTNAGSAPLNLGSIIVPTGFSLVSGFGTTTLATGASTTLVVQLNSTTPGTYTGPLSFVTNDPTRPMVQITLTGTVTVPAIQVSDGTTDVLAGSSSVSFGTTPQGTSISKTLTITDTGTAPLNLSAVSLPTGFSLVSGFDSTTLAPGASTTLVVQMSATTAGNYSGVLSFGTNDPTHATVQITLSGSVTVPTVQILDGTSDVLAGTSTVSFGTTVQGTAVTRTLTITDTGSAPLTLSGTVKLPLGFTLVSGFSSTTLLPGDSTTIVVQMAADSAGSYSGVLSFGTNDPTHSNVQITLSGNVNLNQPKVMYLDDMSSAIKFSGAWRVSSTAGFYGTSNFVHFMQTVPIGTVNAPTATWTTAVNPGVYKISVDWKAASSYSTDAPFTVNDGGTALGTVNINQTIDPVGFTDAGVNWQDLGTFTINSRQLSIVLTAVSSSPKRFEMADAIRIERID